MMNHNQNKPPFFTKKRVILILVFTNLIAVFLLLNIQYNISKVKKQRQLELSYLDTLKYDDNPLYTEQTELFEIYKTQKVNIVMLGSSFTQRVNWNELLERNDVANRGIGSDVSEGYLHRINSVLNLKPVICFIEIGANDIIKNVPVATIFSNTNSILENMMHTVPFYFVTKCFYAAETFPGFESYNLKADSLNSIFDKQLDKSVLIDINPQISENGKRKQEYALKDGIHLNAKAYLVWKKEIKRVLLEKKIVAQ